MPNERARGGRKTPSKPSPRPQKKRNPDETPWLIAARQLFAEELPLPLKRRLTVEIATTRGAELRRAYPAVKSVAAGFRLRRTVRGRCEITDEPCVVFIVHRKRPLADVASRNRLPRHLLCYVEAAGVRRLCAVPTDVDEVAARGRIVLQSRRIEVRPSGGGDALPGTLACAIARELEPGVAYLVSCRHVLGYPSWDKKIAADSTVALPGNANPIAKADRLFVGRISDGTISCDVQLAQVIDPEGCRAALGDTVFADYCHEEHEIVEKELFILTARGPIPVHLNQVLRDDPHNALDYGVEGAHKIVHARLVETLFADPAQRTEDGDSGSPVATRPDGGILVGLHIAVSTKNDGPRAYAVPAWDMLTPQNYDRDAVGETWRLLRPDQIPIPAAPAAGSALAGFAARFAAAFPGRSFTAAMREGFGALVEAASGAGLTNKNEVAYVLGTCWHETGGRMEPVRETFGSDEDEVVRRLERALERGQIKNRYWNPEPNGQRYYGRGYVQLTHAENYRKLGRALGRGDAFFDDPDLVMDVRTAANIAVCGMRDGLFRPENRLSGFDLTTPQGRRDARAIVNSPSDRADEIAGYAEKFAACL
jgi:glycosyl hydrolase family 19 (putative chitinase)